MTTKRPKTIWGMIGANIRFYRLQRQMTQAELAGRICTTRERVQKYEEGVSAISASQLFALAHLFNVPIGVFFEEVTEDGDPRLEFVPCREDVRRFVTSFFRISDTQRRSSVLALVERIAGTNR